MSAPHFKKFYIQVGVHYLTITYMIILSFVPHYFQEFQLECHDKLLDNTGAYQKKIYLFLFVLLFQRNVLCFMCYF
jgi:hypothetical protein